MKGLDVEEGNGLQRTDLKNNAIHEETYLGYLRIPRTKDIIAFLSKAPRLTSSLRMPLEKSRLSTKASERTTARMLSVRH